MSIFAPLKPYTTLIKYGALVAFLVGVYAFGYNNGKNGVLVKTYEKENKALADSVQTATNKINNFNITSQADFDKALKESERRQQEYIASQSRKSYLEDKTRAPETVYVKCVADPDVTKKINESLRDARK